MHAHAFRYVVVNDDLERAVRELLDVQAAERVMGRPRDTWTGDDRAVLARVADVRSDHLSTDDLERVVNS